MGQEFLWKFFWNFTWNFLSPLSYPRQMQREGLKLLLSGDFPALGMPWSCPLERLTRTSADSLACLGLCMIFKRCALAAHGCVSWGEERTAVSLDSPSGCLALLIGKWRRRLMVKLSVYAVKCVFLFFSAYTRLGSLSSELVGGQDSRN